MANTVELFRMFCDGTPLSTDEQSLLIASGLIELSADGTLKPANRGMVTAVKSAPSIFDSIVATPDFSGKLTGKLNFQDAKSPVLTTQVGGDHYKKMGDHQPWQVLATWMTPAELRGYMKGTVIAYLSREADKGGDADIEKAAHTIALWQAVRKDAP